MKGGGGRGRASYQQRRQPAGQFNQRVCAVRHVPVPHAAYWASSASCLAGEQHGRQAGGGEVHWAAGGGGGGQGATGGAAGQPARYQGQARW